MMQLTGFVAFFLFLFLGTIPQAVADSLWGVASGGSHTMALKGDGTVWTWGYNGFDQLGDGLFVSQRTTPLQVKGPLGTGILGGVSAIDGGSFHTLCVRVDGTVWAWGRNEYGQLGDGTTTTRKTPVQVKGPGGVGVLTGVTAVAGGLGHTIALKSDGTVWAWGNNDYGQLGDGTGGVADRYTPVQVKGPGGVGVLTGVTAIASGSYSSIALQGDGTVWAWGWNDTGQLGDGTTTDRYTPVQVKGPGGVGVLTGVTAISSDWHHTIALKGDGTVWAWGYNYYGQLGDGTATDRHTPVQVKGYAGWGVLTGITAVASASTHNIALTSDGTVYAWGLNNDGQLGDGTTTLWRTPVQVKGPGGLGMLTGVTAVAGGVKHTIALKSDGTVWAWGNNEYGQLGDGTTIDRTTPVQVKGPAGRGWMILGMESVYEYYIPYWLSDGGYWTGVGIRNGSSVGAATVRVSGVGRDGAVVDFQTNTVPARGQTAFMMARGTGWVKVASDQPLTGLAFIAEASKERLMFDMTLIPETAPVLYVPHVAQDETWDTVVYVCNPNDSATSVNLTFVPADGLPATAREYTVCRYGSASYPLSEVVGTGSHASGSIEIAASQGVAAFALYHNLKTGDMSYAGVSAVAP